MRGWRTLCVICVSLLAAIGLTANAAYVQIEMPVTGFPQEHEYQKQLRAFMATLTEQDFAVERKEIPVTEPKDPEEAYRLWVLSLYQTPVGSATLPPAAFTLKEIESQKGLKLPCVPYECQNLAWLAGWKYPGNPYLGNRALKLRAFVLAATDCAMLDYLYEHHPAGVDSAARADYLGGNMIWMGYTYGIVKDILPKEALAGFTEGLKKHVLRINKWGPTGQMTDMDLFAPVGLWYISQALGDPEIAKIAESYSKQLFTTPHYFDEAGYFVDNGCFDTSYNGISLYFGTWAALLTDWKFTQDAMTKAFRLRAHLSFPDPDGTLVGPSEMSSRTSGDPPHDQWQFPHRPYAAAMISDDAVYMATLPSADALKTAAATVVGHLNEQLKGTHPAQPQTWKETHWSNSLNMAYEYYKKGYYPRAETWAKENSLLLKPLYKRGENFIHTFEKTFVIAKQDTYGAAIHTGPVGRPVGHNGLPYGFGGGEIAVFWTPSTGSVIVGRRRGVQGAVFDSYPEWREWPVHAVTGLTAADELVSSARIERPKVDYITTAGAGVVAKAAGTMPKYNKEHTAVTPSLLNYTRVIAVEADRVSVTTDVQGGERMAELYETLPVFLKEHGEQKAAAISFRVNDAWAPATAEPQQNVTAVKIERFDGAVTVTFDLPQTVKLSGKVWKDGYMSQVECRTVLIDLLGGGAPKAFQGATVTYRIEAVKK